MTLAKPIDEPQTEQFNLTNDRQIEIYWNCPMTADKLYTSLTANTIIAKLATNTFNLQTLFP